MNIKLRNRLASLTTIFTLGVSHLFAQNPVNFTIQVDQSAGKISPHMWGVFFEDINMGADGGIYAELVKNRSFEFAEPWMGWKKLGEAPEGTFLIVRDNKRKGNARALQVHKPFTDRLGLQNEGFRGMGIKAGESYEFSMLYQQFKPGLEIHVELIDENEQIIGRGQVPLTNGQGWQTGSVVFNSSKTTAKGKLNIWIEGSGDAQLDMISLFPKATWKNRAKGLRKDMVELLADMKPGFVRFPGGCIVEGRDLATRFQWKKTVGPIEERELIINRWNTEFSHRPAPDYFQSYGLGFYEYFLLSEDIGAEPVPILNCGMACQFNTGEVVPLDELEPYIQDALDLIEFANGSVETTWGKLRADMGHPEPFHLKMLGIGNENWGPQYIERLQIFKKILKEKHPEIALIASSGTDPEGERFDYLDKELRAMDIDIIDEHYYRPPSWFLSSASRYDQYDRNGSKVFAGEYASHTTRPNGPGRSTWEAALSEAAFLTGLERNADVVAMASYAPLFGHVDGWQWSPDLIWVDNLQAYGTPSYQVQKLYSLYKGTDIIPILRDGASVTGQDNFFASSVYDAEQKQLFIKFINYSDQPVVIKFNLNSKRKIAAQAVKITLANPDLNVANSFEEPLKIQPKEEKISLKGKVIQDTVSPYSFTVVKVPVS